MRRALVSAAAVIIAIVAQLAVVNRLNLPGGAPPDVVLLVVVGLALSGGPAAGALTGFCAGLGLDLAPPGSPLAGEYALVLCLVGYGCGCLRGLLGRPVRITPVPVAAGIIAAAAGEILATAITLALSPGQATWAVVRQLLPATIFADAALSLLVIPLMLLAGRLADGPAPVPGAARPAPAQLRARQGATAGGLAGRRRRALRGAGALRDGWLGRPEPPRRPPAARAPSGAPWLRTASARRLTGQAGTPRPPLPGREPRLRLGGSRGALVPRQGGPARRPALPRLSFTVPRRRWPGSAASPAAGRPLAAATLRFGPSQRGRLRRALRPHSRAAQLAGYGAAGAGRPALRAGGYRALSAASPAGPRPGGEARRMLPAQLTVARRGGSGPAVPSGRRMFRRPGRTASRPRGPQRRGAVARLHRGSAARLHRSSAARLRGGRRPLLPRWIGRLRRDRASGWAGRGTAGRRTRGPR